jgi:thiol-disulfide isomerase/thioredoxin
MSRFAVCLLLALCACDKKSAASASKLCDVEFAGTSGPKFTVPALVDGTVADSASTWRWISIWATWCKPCIEEMPMLVKWHERLGKRYELAFISIDEDPADVAEFRKAHPETPQSPRLAEPAKQGDWYVSLGLEAKAVVPMQVFVAPSGHVRCVREGSVGEADFATVEKLITN